MVNTTVEFTAFNQYYPKCFLIIVNTKIHYFLSLIMVIGYDHYTSYVCEDATKFKILLRKELL